MYYRSERVLLLVFLSILILSCGSDVPEDSQPVDRELEYAKYSYDDFIAKGIAQKSVPHTDVVITGQVIKVSSIPDKGILLSLDTRKTVVDSLVANEEGSQFIGTFNPNFTHVAEMQMVNILLDRQKYTNKKGNPLTRELANRYLNTFVGFIGKAFYIQTTDGENLLLARGEKQNSPRIVRMLDPQWVKLNLGMTPISENAPPKRSAGKASKETAGCRGILCGHDNEMVDYITFGKFLNECGVQRCQYGGPIWSDDQRLFDCDDFALFISDQVTNYATNFYVVSVLCSDNSRAHAINAIPYACTEYEQKKSGFHDKCRFFCFYEPQYKTWYKDNDEYENNPFGKKGCLKDGVRFSDSDKAEYCSGCWFGKINNYKAHPGGGLRNLNSALASFGEYHECKDKKPARIRRFVRARQFSQYYSGEPPAWRNENVMGYQEREHACVLHPRCVPKCIETESGTCEATVIEKGTPHHCHCQDHLVRENGEFKLKGSSFPVYNIDRFKDEKGKLDTIFNESSKFRCLNTTKKFGKKTHKKCNWHIESLSYDAYNYGWVRQTDSNPFKKEILNAECKALDTDKALESYRLIIENNIETSTEIDGLIEIEAGKSKRSCDKNLCDEIVSERDYGTEKIKNRYRKVKLTAKPSSDWLFERWENNDGEPLNCIEKGDFTCTVELKTLYNAIIPEKTTIHIVAKFRRRIYQPKLVIKTNSTWNKKVPNTTLTIKSDASVHQCSTFPCEIDLGETKQPIDVEVIVPNVQNWNLLGFSDCPSSNGSKCNMELKDKKSLTVNFEPIFKLRLDEKEPSLGSCAYVFGLLSDFNSSKVYSLSQLQKGNIVFSTQDRGKNGCVYQGSSLQAGARVQLLRTAEISGTQLMETAKESFNAGDTLLISPKIIGNTSQKIIVNRKLKMGDDLSNGDFGHLYLHDSIERFPASLIGEFLGGGSEEENLTQKEFTYWYASKTSTVYLSWNLNDEVEVEIESNCELIDKRTCKLTVTKTENPTINLTFKKMIRNTSLEIAGTKTFEIPTHLTLLQERINELNTQKVKIEDSMDELSQINYAKNLSEIKAWISKANSTLTEITESIRELNDRNETLLKFELDGTDVVGHQATYKANLLVEYTSTGYENCLLTFERLGTGRKESFDALSDKITYSPEPGAHQIELNCTSDRKIDTKLVHLYVGSLNIPDLPKLDPPPQFESYEPCNDEITPKFLSGIGRDNFLFSTLYTKTASGMEVKLNVYSDDTYYSQKKGSNRIDPIFSREGKYNASIAQPIRNDLIMYLRYRRDLPKQPNDRSPQKLPAGALKFINEVCPPQFIDPPDRPHHITVTQREKDGHSGQISLYADKDKSHEMTAKLNGMDPNELKFIHYSNKPASEVYLFWDITDPDTAVAMENCEQEDPNRPFCTVKTQAGQTTHVKLTFKKLERELNISLSPKKFIDIASLTNEIENRVSELQMLHTNIQDDIDRLSLMDQNEEEIKSWLNKARIAQIEINSQIETLEERKNLYATLQLAASLDISEEIYHIALNQEATLKLNHTNYDRCDLTKILLNRHTSSPIKKNSSNFYSIKSALPAAIEAKAECHYKDTLKDSKSLFIYAGSIELPAMISISPAPTPNPMPPAPNPEPPPTDKACQGSIDYLNSALSRIRIDGQGRFSPFLKLLGGRFEYYGTNTGCIYNDGRELTAVIADNGVLVSGIPSDVVDTCVHLLRWLIDNNKPTPNKGVDYLNNRCSNEPHGQ